jgi:hypothetical protein
VDILQEMLGDHVSDTIPPQVELLPPIADASQSVSYLQVRAHDPNAALSKIELHVVANNIETVSVCGDGRLPCTLDGELASFALPVSTFDQQVWAVAEDTGKNRVSTVETVVHAGPPSVTQFAVAVAPVAAMYRPDGIVEIQALVVDDSAVTEAVLVWSDGDGVERTVPLCPRSHDGRYGVSMHLGHGDSVRSFYLRVTDIQGRTVTSDAEVVTVSAP